MQSSQPALERLRARVLDAGRSGEALEIIGGGTKRFYGNPPRGARFETRELAGIVSYEPTELVVTALAGTPLADLEAALAERGQCLPFEPPRFGAGGTVGGMVAAGLSGPARGASGPVRDYVLGLTVLTGTGAVLNFGGQVMKNVAGYDVSRVFAGSMGVLGVICAVSLKVMPTPAAHATLRFDLDQASALAQLNRWAGRPFPLSASSWHRGELRLRVAGARAAVESARALPGGTEVEHSAADPWWSDLRDQRHAFFGAGQIDSAGGECLWRLSVPDSTPPLGIPGEQWIEWGGAQRWLRGDAPAAVIRAAATRAGGHATLMRAADKSAGVFTAIPAPAMTVHTRLKRAFDPAGMFNPGRLYPEL